MFKTVSGTFNVFFIRVTCVATETCILPCSYQGGSDALIHWFHVTPQYVRIHAYYHNQDQLYFQNQRYRGRTSLFKDQLSRGNASVQLTGVEVQDQGRYRCFVNAGGAIKVSLVNLKVEDTRNMTV
uniref:Ig-like domain-containing protein n=1 Tax=Seriola dumerili TaxID=41447 RepID=A0A3B4U5E9_SERDU